MNSIPLPRTIPVMVLDDCFLFPGCHRPLRIFEPRYKLMLHEALQGDRMFCIGSRREDPVTGKEDVWPFTTVALISTSVEAEDGTSQLVLTGLQRIRLTAWTRQQPYRIAEFETIPTQIVDPSLIESMVQKLRDFLPHPDLEYPAEIAGFLQRLRTTEDPSLLCDIMAHHWPIKPTTSRQLLGEPTLDKRWQILWNAMEGNIPP